MWTACLITTSLVVCFLSVSIVSLKPFSWSNAVLPVGRHMRCFLTPAEPRCSECPDIVIPEALKPMRFGGNTQKYLGPVIAEVAVDRAVRNKNRLVTVDTNTFWNPK